MKLLFISLNYFPDLTGIGKFNGEMVSWLVEQGHDICFISAPPYYPEWRVSRGYSAISYKLEKSRNLKVIRCPIWVPSKPSGVARILHLLSFALSSFPVVFWQLIKRPDVVFLTEPPFFCAPVVSVLSKLLRVKSILHVQDLEIDAAFDLGIVKQKWVRWAIHRIESITMRIFDIVSSISGPMLDKIRQKGLPDEKLFLFPNWVDIDQIHPLAGQIPLRQSLGITEDSIVALYSGNMGEKQGLEIIIEAARQIKDDRLMFVMCGNGSAYEDLYKRAQGLKNVKWLALQPVEKLNELLNMADIHLLPQRSDVTDLVMPSKLTGIMASGKPCLATAQSGTQVWDVLQDCGIVTAPENQVEFNQALDILINNESLRIQYGENARKYAVENFEKCKILQRFQNKLEDMVRSNAKRIRTH